MSSWPPVSTHLHLTVCLQTFENESDRFSEKIGWACVFVAKFRRHPELFFKSSIQGSNTLQNRTYSVMTRNQVHLSKQIYHHNYPQSSHHLNSASKEFSQKFTTYIPKIRRRDLRWSQVGVRRQTRNAIGHSPKSKNKQEYINNIGAARTVY